MAEAGELGFNAISWGVDQIPDHYLDYVPGVGIPKAERQRRKREQKEQSRRNSRGETKNKDPQSYPANNTAQDSIRRSRNQDESFASPDYPSPRQRGTRAPMASDQYYPGHSGSDYYDRRSYNPNNYLPPDEYDRGGGGSTYGRESSYLPPAPRHSSNNRRREDSYDSDYDSRERDNRHRRNRSDSRERSKSKGGMIKDKLGENFETSERGLTTGAIGALAGGLVGAKVGKGKLGTIAGAVIGGLGANAWEARNKDDNESHSHRRARSSDPHAYPPDSSSRRELEPYGARGGSRAIEYSEDEDDDYESRRRRKLERRAAKKRKEADEEERKAHSAAGNWGNILHS